MACLAFLTLVTLLQVFSHLCLILTGLGVLSGARLSTFGMFLGDRALDPGIIEAQGPMVRGASRGG